MLRVLIVDDEAPARRRLRRLLGEIPDVEVMGEAAGGLEAIETVRQKSPDVMLLDVQMPELDGLGVAQALADERRPAIVFVTAYDEYAVRAFEVNAIDYLLKPVGGPRLRQALQRVGARQTPALAAALAELRGMLPARRYLERLFVEDRGRIVPVVLDRVERILAEQNYVRLCTDGIELLHRSTVTALATVLDPDRFARVSRSAIVRLGAIRELVPIGHGDLQIVLHSGATTKWSRLYRDAAGP